MLKKSPEHKLTNPKALREITQIHTNLNIKLKAVKLSVNLNLGLQNNYCGLMTGIIVHPSGTLTRPLAHVDGGAGAPPRAPHTMVPTRSASASRMHSCAACCSDRAGWTMREAGPRRSHRRGTTTGARIWGGGRHAFFCQRLCIWHI